MSRYVWLPTTEEHEWIELRFRVERRGLTYMQARRYAVQRRLAGYLARVRRDGEERYFVAVFQPRRNAPRRCDLVA